MGSSGSLSGLAEALMGFGTSLDCFGGFGETARKMVDGLGDWGGFSKV